MSSILYRENSHTYYSFLGSQKTKERFNIEMPRLHFTAEFTIKRTTKGWKVSSPDLSVPLSIKKGQYSAIYIYMTPGAQRPVVSLINPGDEINQKILMKFTPPFKDVNGQVTMQIADDSLGTFILRFENVINVLGQPAKLESVKNVLRSLASNFMWPEVINPEGLTGWHMWVYPRYSPINYSDDGVLYNYILDKLAQVEDFNYDWDSDLRGFLISGKELKLHRLRQGIVKELNDTLKKLDKQGTLDGTFLSDPAMTANVYNGDAYSFFKNEWAREYFSIRFPALNYIVKFKITKNPGDSWTISSNQLASPFTMKEPSSRTGTYLPFARRSLVCQFKET